MITLVILAKVSRTQKQRRMCLIGRFERRWLSGVARRLERETVKVTSMALMSEIVKNKFNESYKSV